MEQVSEGLYDNMKGKFKFNVEYTCIENQFNFEIIDVKPVNIQDGDIIEVYLLAEEDLLTDKWDGPKLSNSDINGMHQIIRLVTAKLLKTTAIEEDVFIQI